MFEGGLVARAGRQQDRPGQLRLLRRHAGQALAQRAEVGCQPLNLALTVQTWEHAGGDDAVLQRVGSSAGRLGAVVQHHGLATGIPRQVHRVGEQLVGTGQLHPRLLTQEPRMVEHDCRGDQPFRQQSAGSVEIGEDQVQQLRTLDDP